MISPQSNKKREPRQFKRTRKHTHKNNKFYSGAAWRNLRSLYITKLTNHQYDAIPLISALDHRKAYLIDNVPICETCYRLYIHGAYDKVNKGEELDHIDPINPDGALQSEGWGEPLDQDNLQLLCRGHHSKKTTRDKRIINKKRKGIGGAV